MKLMDRIHGLIRAYPPANILTKRSIDLHFVQISWMKLDLKTWRKRIRRDRI